MLPDVSGMSGTIKTERTPSAQTSLSRSNQPSRHLLPHLGRPRISPTKERGRSHWRRLASRLKARGSDFTSPSHPFSKGTLIADLVRSTRLMISFEIPSVNMLHWSYRSNAQSLELVCDGLNQGTLVRVAGRAYRTCPVCYRTCPVWPSRAAPLLPFDSIRA